MKKYYNATYYDNAYEGKKRGRKTKKEREEYNMSQRLKITYGNFILNFD